MVLGALREKVSPIDAVAGLTSPAACSPHATLLRLAPAALFKLVVGRPRSNKIVSAEAGAGPMIPKARHPSSPAPIFEFLVISVIFPNHYCDITHKAILMP
jgi:hypothetical protein